MKFWKQHFTTGVASSFLALSLVTVAVVGSVAFVRAREALKQAAYDRLSVTATLKESEIERWFEACERDFLLITQFPDVQIHLKMLLNSKPDDANYQSVYNTLSDYLKNITKLKPQFTEIFLLDRSNQTILSTDRRHEGKYEIAANLTYFETVEPGESFTPVFYRSPTTGKPAITFAAPIRDATGARQGVIVAHLKLERIDQIVRQRTGLGETGETYIVGSLVNQNSFISVDPATKQSIPKEPHSEGIVVAMQGRSGAGLYRNYANVPVIGVYRWLKNQDIALLVEMSQAEAFAPARQLAVTIVLVGLTAAGVLLVGVNQLARQLKRSREQLENYSHQLEQKAQEAEAANRAKSEFLANMSHELRTPLNAILGFAQIMVRDSSASASQLKHLNVISRSGEHLLALINDVLSMAKIEAGRTVLSETSFDLYHLLTSLEEMLTIKAKLKGLELTFEYAKTVPRYVQTDEGKLRQVLLNLLGNAIKFTEQGQVKLQVRAEQGSGLSEASAQLLRLWFEVSDTGFGIAASELNSLFDPFFQTAKTRLSHQGTGLGLTISQRFVNLMGGNIAVSSTLGEGATFTFDIPVKLTEAMEVQPQISERKIVRLEPHQSDYRILVVEDMLENRQLLVELLASVGFEVREAENGREGVRLWETWNPHLIWMDMRMPVMDGYEAVRQIRAREVERKKADSVSGEEMARSQIATPKDELYSTQIIAITASAFEEDRTAVLAVGCDDFVRKPFQASVIFEKMAQYLGVRYIYEETSPTSTLSGSGSAIAFADLAVMPPEWIQGLHEAAIEVDAARIYELLAAIPTDCTTLVQHLSQLTQNYDFDAIIDLTQGTDDV